MEGISTDRIERIVEIRKLKAELSGEEAKISSPVLNDFSLIDGIYDVFTRSVRNDRGAVILRKEFLFIVMYLYSPSTLAGGKMEKGLRGKIGEILGIYGKSVISDNVSTLMLTYNVYAYFRSDVEQIFREVMKWLRKIDAIHVDL